MALEGRSPASLQLSRLRVTFEGADRPVLDDFSLEAAPGETIALLGPSGSGKTTVLRSVAGFQPLDSGTMTMNGVDLAGVPVHKRGIGYMFQDHALFPHLDVAANVEFGLRMQHVAAGERRRRVGEVLSMMDLGGLTRRSVDDLSGGERQRVALARALAPNPGLLMLDEPLGALDRVLREHLTTELATLFTELGITVIYVTHDQGEALALADRIAVMDHGSVIQVDTPTQLCSRPVDAFVARFLGFSNVVTTEVRSGVTHDALHIALGGSDRTATLIVRGEAVSLTVDPARGVVGTPRPGVVERVMFAGDHTRIRVIVGTGEAAITLETTHRSPEPPPARGTVVVVDIDTELVDELG